MSKESKKSLEASYYLQRIGMVRKLKYFRKDLERIALEGIKNDEDETIAKIACSILASDYHYEESIMGAKGGKYKPLIDPPK